MCVCMGGSVCELVCGCVGIGVCVCMRVRRCVRVCVCVRACASVWVSLAEDKDKLKASADELTSYGVCACVCV